MVRCTTRNRINQTYPLPILKLGRSPNGSGYALQSFFAAGATQKKFPLLSLTQNQMLILFSSLEPVGELSSEEKMKRF
jgi:hypothetical protein